MFSQRKTRFKTRNYTDNTHSHTKHHFENKCYHFNVILRVILIKYANMSNKRMKERKMLILGGCHNFAVEFSFILCLSRWNHVKREKNALTNKFKMSEFIHFDFTQLLSLSLYLYETKYYSLLHIIIFPREIYSVNSHNVIYIHIYTFS